MNEEKATVEKKTVTRPKSPTSMYINLIGLITMTIAIFYVKAKKITPLNGSFLVIMSIIIPIVLLEFIFLKPYKRESTGLDFKSGNQVDINRVVVKLLGLYLTLGLITLLYLFFPVYRNNYYDIYWLFIKKAILPIILIGSIPYFIFMDKFLKEPKETYYNAGLILLGRWKEVDTADFKNHMLGWLVKAFFLPIMVEGVVNNIGYFQGDFIKNWFSNFNDFFNITKTYIFTIDLAFVTMGYLMTLRIFDSHIRTAEPTFYGWGVALLCYPPFNNQLHPLYINYNDGFEWNNWLYNSEFIYIIWGVVILFLFGIYVWATIPFGIRFSNLTHRGILTNGPYRFMKHPAYVSKNLAWWLVSVPFISKMGVVPAIFNCLALLILNFIYFHRARTEENHLSKDPTYIQYATYMNENGIFRKLFRSVPFFRYKPEKYLNVPKEVNIQK